MTAAQPAHRGRGRPRVKGSAGAAPSRARRGIAARCGQYPGNGAERSLVTRDEADELLEEHGEWSPA